MVVSHPIIVSYPLSFLYRPVVNILGLLGKVHADAEHLLGTAQIAVGIMLVRYLTHRLFGTLVQLELHHIDATALADS